MPVATYDPKKNTVVLGSHIVTDLATGTHISIQRNSDVFSRAVGAGGEVARIKNADRSGRITLTLMQTSPTNDFLSGLFSADESANAGKVPFLMKEHGGSTVCAAPEVWVVKPANVEYGSADLVNRVWTLEAAELSMFIGSNPKG